MATLSIEILDAAHNDGFIPRRLSKSQALYLHNSVLTANQLYWLIAEDQGVDLEQLERCSKLNHNTVKQYIRWMIQKGIILIDADNPTRKYTFFTSRKHPLIKAKR